MSTEPKLYSLEFRLEGLPKTTNSGGRAHWAVKALEARKWKNSVAGMVGTNKPKEPLQKAKLTLRRCSSSAPDFDGLVSSFKHVVDALQDCGVIVNDKMTTIGTPTYEWFPASRGKGFITVKVEELRD